MSQHRFTRRGLIRGAAGIAAISAGAPLFASCATAVPAHTTFGGGARAGGASADYASPPAVPDPSGVTVSPEDPRISVSRPDVRGSDGASLMAYLAGPRGVAPRAGVLVTHGTRGQTEHVRDVARRLATAGFTALAIDLAARDGGAAGLPDPSGYREALFARGMAGKLDDHRAAVAFLGTAAPAVGAIGSGFGGNAVWKMVDARLELRAAVSFDGPLPANYTEMWRTRTAVFAGYAERNTSVTSTAPSVEAELRRAGVPYRITVYPGVDRGFNDDAPGSERYEPQQARRAWADTVAWLSTYLAS